VLRARAHKNTHRTLTIEGSINLIHYLVAAAILETMTSQRLAVVLIALCISSLTRGVSSCTGTYWSWINLGGC